MWPGQSRPHVSFSPIFVGTDARRKTGHGVVYNCLMIARERADRLLVARGLFESRARAQAAIAAGLVTANGAPVRKASDTIAIDAVIEAAPAHPYVSRGALKLAAALDHFHLDVADRVCLDVGASTGGFVEIIAARGARLVYAIDVGSAQLHPRLRGRSNIVSMEQTDIRTLDPSRLAEPPDLAVVDVSFISLKLVLPAIGKLVLPRAAIVALIKPQFEVQRSANKKGIVRDPEIHRAVCNDIAAFLTSLGWRVEGLIPSPILGGDGNREFLIGAKRG
jgi:23S rRNA (cytidine1920-2'-O)/16S rRNA (cytidine1409-2'-O)-methyltransferase